MNEWMDSAACLGMDPNIFHPEAIGRRTARPRAVAAAKAVCAVCPHTVACLNHAIETGEQRGIWGGLTADERDRVAGRVRTGPAQQPINHGTYGGWATHRRRGETPCDECRDAKNRYYLSRAG